ncbi:MAG: methyltransferase [Actinomycetota bacterium]
MILAVADPGSFRDPSSRVFHVQGRVLRGVKGDAVADWARLEDSGLLSRLVERGAVVATWEIPAHELPPSDAGPWTVVLEHKRVPFVSYPYEWSFRMLQDAAALHLEILIEALAGGMTLKDGSAFNVQWAGGSPVFVDVVSFERSTGQPWAGYRQFCQTFLYPLLLQAHRGIPFQPFLRGHVDGLTAPQMRGLLAPWFGIRAGVFKHVVLHDAMQARFTGDAQTTARRLQEAGFSDELASAVARSLLKLVLRLRPSRRRSPWIDYTATCSYGDSELATKAEVVERAFSGVRARLVFDLGCNDGTYARIAAASGAYVVAVDSDEAVIDRLYTSLREEDRPRVLPLVLDLADPNPGLGWRGQERRAFFDRGRPDVVLCLALLHHLVIGRSVPLDHVVEWLRSFDARVVVEFVSPDDPMAERLLANKAPGIHADYGLEGFERALGERFRVQERAALGTRTIFTADPR